MQEGVQLLHEGGTFHEATLQVPRELLQLLHNHETEEAVQRTQAKDINSLLWGGIGIDMQPLSAHMVCMAFPIKVYLRKRLIELSTGAVIV